MDGSLGAWELDGIERLSPTVPSDDGEFEWVTIQMELGAAAKAFLRVQILDLQ